VSFEDLMSEAWNVETTAVRVAVQRDEQYEGYARAGVEGYYSGTADLYKPFSQMPDPKAYDVLIDDLRSAMQDLSYGDRTENPTNTKENYLANPTLAKITTAGGWLSTWSGHAAKTFKSNFVDPFPFICENQFILLSILKGALEAHRAMWDHSRTIIDQIALDTVNALEHIPRCDPTKWSVTFTVVASVAAVAAVPLAGVAGAALAVTAVGAASQVVAADPPKPYDGRYSASTVHGVIDEMKRAIKTLAGDIGTAESVISSALHNASQLISSHQPYFVSHRPELADGNAGNLTSGAFLGDAN
jgi:hypothetical protein